MKKLSSFSGSLGFVLAAAGSAVGVGNIWRFPYLCAKDGGGLFLLVYLVLVLTFGFTLLTTDVAIGRRTKQNALNAFATLNKKWKFLGYLTFLVPTLIMTYYSVIGGWITKYFTLYLVSSGDATAQDGFFTSFITSPVLPIVFMLIFLALTAWVVYCGVEKGIEKYSRYIMPGLLLLIIGIAIFSLTLSYTDESGMTRTGIEGLLVYIKPDFTGLTVQRFLNIALDAMSQLFFSLSVSMGIMITYGSYVKDDVDLNKANNQIEIFDTGVAFLAGLMIIPAVYVFLGTDGMASGPSLTFISLPKVFAAMGGVGRVIGAVFFLALGFAALTSCVSVMETLVANCMEIFHKSRREMCAAVGVYSLVTAVLICMGYTYEEAMKKIPNGIGGDMCTVSRSTGLTVYLHYEPGGINNWSVVLGVSEAEALAGTRGVVQTLSMMAIIVTALLLSYLGFMVWYLAAARRGVYRMSITDQGTGLMNRVAYEKCLRKSDQRVIAPAACIYIDANGLHEINNERGHEAGDQLLHAVAERLREQFPRDDLYRVGGDEFVVFPAPTAEAEYEARMRAVSESLAAQGYSISYGIAVCEAANGLRELVREADEKMLGSKRAYYAEHDRRRPR